MNISEIPFNFLLTRQLQMQPDCQLNELKFHPNKSDMLGSMVETAIYSLWIVDYLFKHKTMDM